MPHHLYFTNEGTNSNGEYIVVNPGQELAVQGTDLSPTNVGQMEPSNLSTNHFY